MKILLNFLIIIQIILDISTFKIQETRGWESICSILSCKPVLENCIRNNCLGKENCRNCVLSENPICVRCVDGLLDEQYFTINGAQTILCDPVNNLHQTTCNFYCRMKETMTWKCEQIGGYPLCNCESELITTTTTTRPIPTATATTAAVTTTTATTTITSTTTSTSKKPLGSLIGKKIIRYKY
jgi:hypothetical protein